jgi:hypothetical protein
VKHVFCRILRQKHASLGCMTFVSDRLLLRAAKVATSQLPLQLFDLLRCFLWSHLRRDPMECKADVDAASELRLMTLRFSTNPLT